MIVRRFLRRLRAATVLGSLLIVAGVIPWTGAPGGAAGPTRPRAELASRKRMRDRLVEIERKKNLKKQQLAQARQKERTAIRRLEDTEDNLQVAQLRFSNTKLNLDSSRRMLKIISARLQLTRRQLARRQELLSDRLLDVYEGESVSYLNVLLGSADMWTLLTRAYDVQQVVHSDVELIEQIRKDQAQIERDKEARQRKVAEFAHLADAYQNDRDYIAGLVEERQDELAEIENDVQAYRRAVAALEAASREVERQIWEASRTPAGRRRSARPFRGSLGLPVSGKVTSDFGYRRHPINHIWSMHTGIDIGAPTGTPITAAADGEVILAGRIRIYGNAVVIDHGGNVSTLYGHCSALLVRKGEQVKRGQVIARVGSTGWSTGSHLHYEKRVNGTPVRPN